MFPVLVFVSPKFVAVNKTSFSVVGNMNRSPKKKVSVSFAGDDSILHHICPDSAEKSNKNMRTRSLRKSSAVDNIMEEEKENTDFEDEEVFKHSEALSEGNDIFGNQVFGFKTPKKSGQMAQKASESALARTPKSSRKSDTRTPKSPKTPKSILKKRSSVLEETGTTPARKRSSKRLHKVAAQTPHRLRSRLKEDSSDASSSEDSAVSESDNESTADVPGTESTSESPKHATTPGVTPSKRARGKKKDKDSTVQAETVESYFDAQNLPTVTSDRTLSKLETPRMDQEQLNEALEGVELPYKHERENLNQEYRAQFNKWMYLMCNDYNLLFHGLGSKRQLLEDFRTSLLADFNHIVINGFFPSLTIKSILNHITEDILNHRGSFRSPIEQCEFIRKQYEHNEYEDLYLVIHNIDGPMLRPDKVQSVLSLLAQIRGFHILASIDHINAPLIWDHTKASRFNWLWLDVTSYDSYTEETSYENSLLVQQSGVLALSSLTHVMRSLTPNAKGIFLLLVRYQIENKDSNYQGLAFPDLYQKCREAFLVNSDLTLRTQLTEFRDHKLIRTKKGYDGVEYLVIPLDEATLKEFIEQQEGGS